MKLKRLNTNQNGFTIVELLVIIIIISVLGALVFVSFRGIQQKNRNSERQADIKLLHTQIEAYFAQNAKYPTLSNMNDAKWLTANMKSLEADTLRDPQGSDGKLVTAPTPAIYSYDVKASDDGTCDNEARDCVKYTLTATYEGTGIFTRNNLN